MIFDTSIRKELGRNFVASFLVLLTIVLTIVLIRTLGFASKGVIGPADMILFMFFSVLGQLPLLLSFSVLVCVVATIGRMYADSEMAVWFAAGQGQFAFVRPILRFALPVLISVALVTLFVWPWANQQLVELRQRFAQRSSLERLVPGQFQESRDGKKVFFIEQTPNANTFGDKVQARNLFVASIEAEQETFISAPSARMVSEGGKRFLELQGGQQVERSYSGADLRIVEFARLRVDADFGQSNLDVTVYPPRALGLGVLWARGGPQNVAELFWRLSMPVVVLFLLFYGLAIAYTKPRAGRSLGLMYAIFIFIFYYNLLNIAQNWVASARFSAVPLFVLLHGCMGVLALLWVQAHSRQWSLRGLWEGVWRRDNANSNSKGKGGARISGVGGASTGAQGGPR